MSLKKELQKISSEEVIAAFERTIVKNSDSAEQMTTTILAVREEYPGLYELSEHIGKIATQSQDASKETAMEDPVRSEDCALGALYFALGLIKYAEVLELRYPLSE